MMRRRAVKPSGCRRGRDPRMLRACVVHHVVDQHLHAEAVSVSNKCLIVLHGANMVVESVKVNDVVAVVIGISVLPDRSQPESGYTKVVQISEMVSNATQIAAMVRPGIASVIYARRPRRLIVRRITIGEAVGHDQVNHVVPRETFKAFLKVSSRQQRQLYHRRSGGIDQPQKSRSSMQ